MNSFNEDICWASIDADQLNTSWDMLLTDVKTMKSIKLLSIFAWKLQKTCSAKEKSKKTSNTPRQRGFYKKKIKIATENTEVNKSSNHRKCTKSDKRN